MKQYGILLIGCGHIGEAHIADIYYRENIRIIAVVDTDIEKANMLLYIVLPIIMIIYSAMM